MVDHICHTSVRATLLLASQIRAIPDDQLLLESDAPDGHLRLDGDWLEQLGLAELELALPGSRDEPNTPTCLTATLQIVAAARGQSPEHVARTTARNASSAFGLIP